jgi:hypothetical protein
MTDTVGPSPQNPAVVVVVEPAARAGESPFESWKRAMDDAFAQGERLARHVDQQLRSMEMPQPPPLPEDDPDEKPTLLWCQDVLRTAAWRAVVDVTEAVYAWQGRVKASLTKRGVQTKPPPGAFDFRLRLIDAEGVPIEVRIGSFGEGEVRWAQSIVGETFSTAPEHRAPDLGLRALVAMIQGARAVEVPVYTPGEAGRVDEPSAPSEGTKPQAKSPADGGK